MDAGAVCVEYVPDIDEDGPVAVLEGGEVPLHLVACALLDGDDDRHRIALRRNRIWFR